MSRDHKIRFVSAKPHSNNFIILWSLFSNHYMCTSCYIKHFNIRFGFVNNFNEVFAADTFAKLATDDIFKIHQYAIKIKCITCIAISMKVHNAMQILISKHE